MTKFSIGYNHSTSFIDMLKLITEFVDEVYFQAPFEVMGSGRVVFLKKDYDKEIEKILIECKKNGIKSNLLLNATCQGEYIGEEKKLIEVIDYIKKLMPIGLDRITLTNPIYISKIRKKFPSLEIHSSVNCYVKTVEHAKYLKLLGADVITIDRDINRDIKLIKKIKNAADVKIKILLNEGCLNNCPFRHIHFNMISHNKDTDFFDSNSCITIYKMDPKKIFKIPFVRPEDLKYYDDVADYFKLSTRTSPTLKIVQMMDAYHERSYKGDILNLLSTRGLFLHFESLDNEVLSESNFFEKMSDCDDECENCNYCDDLLKKAAKLRK